MTKFRSRFLDQNVNVNVFNEKFQIPYFYQFLCLRKSLRKSCDTLRTKQFSVGFLTNFLLVVWVEVIFPDSLGLCETKVEVSWNEITIKSQLILRCACVFWWQKNSAYIYAVDDSGKLSEVKSFVPHSESTVTDLQYSPDGQHLAVGLSGRRVFVYDATKEYARLDQVEWIFHSAKVLSVAWHPDGVHLASGSVDSNVELYSLRTPRSHVKLDRAHPQSPITAVGFLDNNRLFSVAFDACVRIWNYDDVNKFWSSINEAINNFAQS